eukprot:GHVU01182238.1.p1 GENE.GHVU01182238.1~~GHVU01182238.1.p1  ORF type:complete len:345 (-),score=26.05 GHVU01182238.1:77-1087(-)
MTQAEREAWVVNILRPLCKMLSRLTNVIKKFSEKSPPVLPSQLHKTSQEEFAKVLAEVEDRVKLAVPNYATWRRLVQEEHSELRALEKTFDHPIGASFDEQWASLQSEDGEDRFPNLRWMAAGLATAYPSNAEVERDFAYIKWIYAPHRQGLGTASLVAALICRQMKQLRKMGSQPSTAVTTAVTTPRGRRSRSPSPSRDANPMPPAPPLPSATVAVTASSVPRDLTRESSPWTHAAAGTGPRSSAVNGGRVSAPRRSVRGRRRGGGPVDGRPGARTRTSAAAAAGATSGSPATGTGAAVGATGVVTAGTADESSRASRGPRGTPSSSGGGGGAGS